MGKHLHWSFDYQAQQLPGVDFAAKIYECIERAPSKSDSRKYAILPNYWFNHQGPSILSTDDLVIGELEISSKRSAEGSWQYDVRQEDTSSGECLRLQFECRDDLYRSLKGGFEINASVDANSSYSSYHCKGQLIPKTDTTEVRLQHSSGLSFSAGQAPSAEPILCEYSLFDTLPSLAAGAGGGQSFAILERLERLYTGHRTGHLQNDVLTPSLRELPVRGYYLRGTGTVPSYWWVDEHGRVVIMTTTLFTYVLRN